MISTQENTVLEKVRSIDLSGLNWEDVHVFTVAARSQSYRQAASTLGITHSTVRRRVASLEASLGFRLFQSATAGLRPTVQAQELLLAARGVEDAMTGFVRQARAADTHFRGPMTATMSVNTALGLAPALTSFAKRWPEIVLTVHTSTDFADLGAMEADVAIRGLPMDSSTDPSLVGKRAATAYHAAYGIEDVEGWIASDDDPSWPSRTPFPDLPVRSVMPEIALRLEACRLGLGMAMLPCFLGDSHLPRRSKPTPFLDIWVLVHPDLRRNERLKLFRDEMIKAISEHSEQLRGGE